MDNSTITITEDEALIGAVVAKVNVVGNTAVTPTE
jgi:hypothetical protein